VGDEREVVGISQSTGDAWPESGRRCSRSETPCLHESGYRCGNPVCRTILTLDIHHLTRIEGGPNTAENLLPLCPNCHAQHHQESSEGLVANMEDATAFAQRAFDNDQSNLLALYSTGPLHVSEKASYITHA